ncbi:hypothetical protein M231_02352 [Tremella mesenterica]|uniref:Mitochondrial adapter protein MCP1 transmembrane domain-containing protein n=1 Tax=Tremella mesenterica TaxID=5217 RepID=A0A4Q1BQZ3_TREME|nr:hypothetical protein M231_02352 [Tremella mesenterica]
MPDSEGRSHHLPDEERPREDDKKQNWRPKFIRLLAGVQNTSALIFSVFLGVHLTVPIITALGGKELGNKVLMIGRTYYHPSESFSTYIPLSLHILTGITKRFLIHSHSKPSRRYSTISSASPITSKTSWSKNSFLGKILDRFVSIIHLCSSFTSQYHLRSSIITGYLLIPFLFSHIMTHRIIPQIPYTPISSLSPSELDLEFVGWNLNFWKGWFGYLGLVGLGLWHGSFGLKRVYGWFGLLSGLRGMIRSVGMVGSGRSSVVEEMEDSDGSSIVGRMGEIEGTSMVDKPERIEGNGVTKGTILPTDPMAQDEEQTSTSTDQKERRVLKHKGKETDSTGLKHERIDRNKSGGLVWSRYVDIKRGWRFKLDKWTFGIFLVIVIGLNRMKDDNVSKSMMKRYQAVYDVFYLRDM